MGMLMRRNYSEPNKVTTHDSIDPKVKKEEPVVEPKKEPKKKSSKKGE